MQFLSLICYYLWQYTKHIAVLASNNSQVHQAHQLVAFHVYCNIQSFCKSFAGRLALA
nr:MAG TPA_asm: hypothetical protein [Caudoviricetes sp.]